MRFGIFTFLATIFLLIALSCPVFVAATEVPRETLERLSNIAVEKAEIRHLNAMGKLTDPEYNARYKILSAEETVLWQPHRLRTQITREETQEAMTTLTGLNRAKLSLLEPKWSKEEWDNRKAKEKQKEQTYHAVEENARKGAQLQRQRLILQRDLDKGKIDRETFDTKDKEALAAIETLRNKHDPAYWGRRFDERLTYYTSSITDKPPTPPAVVKPKTPPVVVTYRPPVVETDYTLWYWIGGGVLLLIIFMIAGDDEEPAPASKPITSDIYGSADWAAYEKTPTTHTDVSRGVTFGKSSLPEYNLNTLGAPITSQPESHTLIIAQSGAGKGTRVIIPTLLRYASSMLVIDPKGENAAITARIRKKQLHQEIQIINPWGVLEDRYSKLGFQTATFNPLDVLDRNDPNVTTTARTLAATICPITDPKNAFWQGSAAKLLGGILLWITDNPLEQKTLARVKEIVSLQKPAFQKILVQMLACDAFHGAIKEAVGQAGDTSAADTYGGIVFQLQQCTDFIDAQIKISTATSTIAMSKLADGSLTVYVIIPFDLMETHSTWLRLVISSAMRSLIKTRESASGEPLHRCMFMIDEFGSIGHIPDIAKHLAQMRGYGMDFTLILQGLNQLKEHYEKSRDSILGNCRYKYFCDVNDLESAKYLSETLGKKTVRTVSTSTSQGATQAGQTEGSSTTHAETGRDLLTPDEILHLGKNTAILLNPDTRPHYLHPIDYWKLQQAYQHLRNSDPHLYWNPPLSYDQNPYINTPQNPFANFRLPPGFIDHFPPMTWDKTKRK